MNKKITIEDAKDYLDFLDKALNNLLINRQIYLDFHNALVIQKAHINDFIKWTLGNYYNTLIINLCKITDVTKYNDDKTLRGFLELCKDSDNWNSFKNARLNQKIYATNLRTDEQIELYAYEGISQIFNTIDIGSDINKVEDIFNQLKSYRHKKIAHLTITDVDIKNLNFNILHKMIDDLEKIMKKYYHLFGIAIINDDLKSPYQYDNFQLHLK